MFSIKIYFHVETLLLAPIICLRVHSDLYTRVEITYYGDITWLCSSLMHHFKMPSLQNNGMEIVFFLNEGKNEAKRKNTFVFT